MGVGGWSYKNIIIFVLFSNRPSGLLRSPAISLEVSLLNIFIWGCSEAPVLVVWNVASDWYAATSFFCIVVGIFWYGCCFKFVLLFISFVVQKTIPSGFSQKFHFGWCTVPFVLLSVGPSFTAGTKYRSCQKFISIHSFVFLNFSSFEYLVNAVL